MNDTHKIKELLDLYYKGESTDADEQQLHEYFASDNVAMELQPYRTLFGYVQREREHPLVVYPTIIELKQSRRPRIWYAVAGVAASLLLAIWLYGEQQPQPVATCTGTYVVINGVCYDDLALVGKYATETINQVTTPVNSSATDALDFLDVK